MNSNEKLIIRQKDLKTGLFIKAISLEQKNWHEYAKYLKVYIQYNICGIEVLTK